MITKLNSAALPSVVFCLLMSPAVLADENPYATAMTKYFEKNYVTLGGGFDDTDNIQFKDIYYEAQLYGHFNWISSEYKNETSDIWQLYLPVRLQVRQYRSDSSPVKTPGYNPGIRVYYAHHSWLNGTDDFHYASLGLHHYSNGQNGPHLDPVSGDINTDTGSFSSDYAELSYYRVSTNQTMEWAKVNYRYYFVNATWEAEQTGFYEDRLVELSGRFSLFDKPADSQDFFDTISLQLTLARKIGRDFITPGIKANDSDNLQYTGELIMKPSGWKDLSMYARWDKGYDYYNINYATQMNRIHFGVVADW